MERGVMTGRTKPYRESAGSAYVCSRCGIEKAISSQSKRPVHGMCRDCRDVERLGAAVRPERQVRSGEQLDADAARRRAARAAKRMGGEA